MSETTLQNSVSIEPKEKNLFLVGDLAALTGKTVRALRLYEEKGLLKPIARSQGGFRLYDEASLTRLKWILQMQRLGFTLGQIAELSEKLNRAETAPAAMVEMRRLFEEKLEEVGAQLNELNALSLDLKSALEFLSTCETCNSENSFSQCCRSQKNLSGLTGEELPNVLAGLYAPYLKQEESK